MDAPRLVRAPGLTEQLVRALELEFGRRLPGERLPTEKQLGERFEVSRAVVREAIARLKADGYVETRQGAGAFIAKKPGWRSFKLLTETARTPADLQHILELRMAVEVAAAELAARRRTERDVGDIREALDAMTAAIREETDGADADDRFHTAIARATHNPYLPRFVAFLRHHFWETRRPTWSAAGYRTGQPRAAQQEHERLFAAIAAGDPRAARQAARTHLLSSASRLGLSRGRTRDFLDDRPTRPRRRPS